MCKCPAHFVAHHAQAAVLTNFDALDAMLLVHCIVTCIAVLGRFDHPQIAMCDRGERDQFWQTLNHCTDHATIDMHIL